MRNRHLLGGDGKRPIELPADAPLGDRSTNFIGRDSDIVIKLEPGLAFGTGHHPTTLMCLEEMEKAPSDPETYLTDGRVMFVISPWRIGDYAGGGIERPALEHIGFKVESVEQVLADLEAMSERSPELAPKLW